MKRVQIIIILLVFALQEGTCQCNYLIVKWHPKSCGDLTQSDECYSIIGVYDNYVKEKYFRDNSSMVGVINDSTREFFDEITLVDKIMLEVFNRKRINLLDTSGVFYMEFITGYNDIQNNYFKIYGAVNCILFFDRIIEKLSIVNPNSELMRVFGVNQEILLFDRLCKCDHP